MHHFRSRGRSLCTTSGAGEGRWAPLQEQGKVVVHHFRSRGRSLCTTSGAGEGRCAPLQEQGKVVGHHFRSRGRSLGTTSGAGEGRCAPLQEQGKVVVHHFRSRGRSLCTTSGAGEGRCAPLQEQGKVVVHHFRSRGRSLCTTSVHMTSLELGRVTSKTVSNEIVERHGLPWGKYLSSWVFALCDVHDLEFSNESEEIKLHIYWILTAMLSITYRKLLQGLMQAICMQYP